MTSRLMHQVRSLKSDQWVAPYLKKYMPIMVLSVALSALALIFAAALMFTSGYMISLAAALPLTVLALHVPSIFVRIFGVGKPVLQYFERLASHDWALMMVSEMRKKLYDLLAKMVNASQSAGLLGDVLSLLNEDIGHVQNLVLRCVLPLASSILLTVIVCVFCGMFSLKLAAAALLLLLVVGIFLPIASACVNYSHVCKLQELTNDAYKTLSNNVFGVSDWILSGRAADYAESFVAQAKRRNNEKRTLLKYQQRIALVNQILLALSVVAIFVWAALVFGCGYTQAASGPLTGAAANLGNANAPAYAANWIAAFAMCVFPLMEAYAPLTNAAIEFDKHAISLTRLNRFGGGGEGASADARASAGLQTAALPPVDVPPAIEISHVTFAYPSSPDLSGAPAAGAETPSHPVLSNFSARISPGEKVVIRGKSGCGKTTLASLIHADIYPTAGSVKLGGVSVHAFANQIHKYVGLVEQFPYIFNMSLKENLLVANGSATDEQLMRALEMVRLDGFLQTLPAGLDTQIYEGGFNMSGGQRQRIGLARVLLANQQIVILDEPFNSLDHETKLALKSDILEVFSQRTVILISHCKEDSAGFDREIFIG